MKKSFIILTLCVLPFLVQCQDKKEKDISLLNAPEGWRPELIPFPLSFAPGLSYKGLEDIRFAKGWADAKSEQFWAYAFVWYLDEDPKLSEEKLEKDFVVYFDGLMQAVGKDKGLKPEDIPTTLTLFMKASEKKGVTSYRGKIQIFDAFFSQDLVKLNVSMEAYFCKKAQKHVALFYISPKDYDHGIWKELEKVELSGSCK